MTLNVRVSGALGEFVSESVSANGSYENVSEYIRDLIRRDKARAEAERFGRLKAELDQAFAAPDDAYVRLKADAVLSRHARPASV
jgi:Arc/MetJ-type ribon-helix-helix transcriptional regulator